MLKIFNVYVVCIKILFKLCTTVGYNFANLIIFFLSLTFHYFKQAPVILVIKQTYCTKSNLIFKIIKLILSFI